MKYMKLVSKGSGKNLNSFDIKDINSGNCGVICVDTDNYVTYHPQTIIQITTSNNTPTLKSVIFVDTLEGGEVINSNTQVTLSAPLLDLNITKNEYIESINIKSIDPCYLKSCSITECKYIKKINGLTNVLNSRDFNIGDNMGDNATFLGNCENLKECDSLENVKLNEGSAFRLYGQLPNNIVYDFQKVDASKFKGALAWCVDKNDIENFDFSNMNIKQVNSLTGFFAHNHNLKRVRGIETINFDSIKSINHMFRDCENLVDIEGFQNIKIADNTDVTVLFFNCPKLWEHEDVNLTNLKNCKSEYYAMFSGCSFKSLNLSGWKIPTKFDESVIHPGFEDMFNGFKGEKLILHGWDLTENQNGIEHKTYTNMFRNCVNLKEIDLGKTHLMNITLWSDLLKKFNLDQKILKYDFN